MVLEFPFSSRSLYRRWRERKFRPAFNSGSGVGLWHESTRKTEPPRAGSDHIFGSLHYADRPGVGHRFRRGRHRLLCQSREFVISSRHAHFSGANTSFHFRRMFCGKRDNNLICVPPPSKTGPFLTFTNSSDSVDILRYPFFASEPDRLLQRRMADWNAIRFPRYARNSIADAVSYTHLTLPTIYSV